MLKPIYFIPALILPEKSDRKSQNGPNTPNISDSIVVNIMLRYLVPQEAVRLLLTCWRFSRLDSEEYWNTLCKWQSPLNWDSDPFCHQIRQIQDQPQNQSQRKLAYHRLCGLRVQKSQEPWKLKTVIDLPSILRPLAETHINCHILYNGTLVVGLKDSIEILSCAGIKIATIPHPKYYDSIPIPGEGRGFVTRAWNDHRAYIWSATGQQIAVLEHHAIVIALLVFSNGEILTQSNNAKIHRWTPDGKLVVTYHFDVPITDFRVFKGQEILVTMTSDGPIVIWSREGEQIATLDHPHCTDMDIFKDGRIVTISADKQVKIWSPDYTFLSTFTHPSTSIGAMYVKILRNENIVTVRRYEEYLCLWSPTGELIATLNHPDWISPPILTLSNGFATNCFDDKMRIWSMTGHLIATLGGRGSRVKAILGKIDGEIITYDWNKRRIHVWTADVERLLRARGIWDQVACVVS